MAIIRDIMSKVVIALRPESTIIDAVKTLTKHHLSGAPVVTPQGEVVGFISEPNLMDVLFDQSVRNAPVSEFMSSSVHVVDSQDSISTAARMFALYGIRRLPVVENGRFVGVVTRRDLLAYSLRNPEPLSEPLLELIPALGEFA
ncbi:MAG TPA: CBS domain-containing protein [Lacipirellulaceae bacterium]|jgi:tRNA nucleotidyltransferase (CCA-adding enzyme)|nr:CBS domain-containing protein [Lacipirellulaceae bacterium]